MLKKRLSPIFANDRGGHTDLDSKPNCVYDIIRPQEFCNDESATYNIPYQESRNYKV